jgi:hypothetical protein
MLPHVIVLTARVPILPRAVRMVLAVQCLVVEDVHINANDNVLLCRLLRSTVEEA